MSPRNFLNAILSLRRRRNHASGEQIGKATIPLDGKHLLQWLRDTNRPSATAELLETVASQLRNCPSSAPDALAVRARLAAHAAMLAYARYGTVEHLADDQPTSIHQVDEIALAGQFDFMKIALEHFLKRWPQDYVLNELNSLLKGPGTGDQFRDDGSDVQIVQRPGSSTTFLIFTGIRRRFAMSIDQLHHVWLSAVPANVVYLRDAKDRLFLLGLGSLGGLDSSIERLSATIRSIGTERTVCLGNSGGVFAALYYGVKLNADLAICFSGPTNLDLGLSANRTIFPALKALHNAGEVPWPNLRELVGDSPMCVRFFYGANSKFDVKQAKNLDGLQNVSLEPLEGIERHSIVSALAQRGMLDEIFQSSCYPSNATAYAHLSG